MAGLTPNGLIIRTQPELAAKIKATLADAFPGIDLDEGPEQQFIEILAELIAEPWEALEGLAGVWQGKGSGVLADWFAGITGTKRRAPTATRVAATVNLDAGVTLTAARAIASIDGNPDAQFALVADVTNSGGSPANVAAIFECLTTGAIAAPAGKLTVIVTPVTGWNSITNAAAGTKGKAIADESELAATRTRELAGRGSSALGAVVAAMQKVAGVQDAQAYENDTSGVVSGRPAKSFEVVVWDDGDAVDADIIQAIYDKKDACAQAYGLTTGTPTKFDTRNAPTIGFTRATKTNLYVDVSAHPVPNAASGWQDQLAQAISDRGLLYVTGQKVWVLQLAAAGENAVAAVEAITALTLGLAPSPGGSAYTPLYNEIVRIPKANVNVTVI